MLARQVPMILLVAVVSLLGVASCAPAMDSEVGTSAVVATATTADVVTATDVPAVTDVPAASTAMTDSAEISATDGPAASSVVTASSEVVSSDSATVTSQVQSNTEQAPQPTGPAETSPGAASEESPATPEAENQEQTGIMALFEDSTYRFSVSYPADFELRTLSAERLSQLTPTPDASFIFMNPVTAASDLGDLEPADLEIRTYSAQQVASLDSWLTSNGLLPTDGSVAPEPFQASNVAGVEVCASTMIAPGCSYFVMGNGQVYQLTPATIDGETMAHTFRLTP